MSDAPAIDTALVRDLAVLVSETDLSEVEVERGDLRIRIVRTIQAATVQVAAPAPAPMAAAAAPAPFAPPAASADKRTMASQPGAVLSPMVGTAYRRSSPEAKAFVEVGSAVKAGDKLLLIEAMKTFNDITADRDGTITSVFVSDGQPVEYGEPLFVIG